MASGYTYTAKGSTTDPNSVNTAPTDTTASTGYGYSAAAYDYSNYNYDYNAAAAGYDYSNYNYDYSGGVGYDYTAGAADPNAYYSYAATTTTYPPTTMPATTTATPRMSTSFNPPLPPGPPPSRSATATSAAAATASTAYNYDTTSSSTTAATDAKAQDGKKKKKVIRTAGGEIWEDKTLTEWDENDFRLFVGDLGNEVTDEALANMFRRYPTFLKAKVVREKRGKSKGYGFVSFKDPQDFARAWREMNGKHCGNRPMKIRKSTWKDRMIENKDVREVKQLRKIKNTAFDIESEKKKQKAE